MTAACRRCGADGQQRFVGSIQVWVHVKPSIDHAFLPPVKVAKPTESEKRAAWGDR